MNWTERLIEAIVNYRCVHFLNRMHCLRRFIYQDPL